MGWRTIGDWYANAQGDGTEFSSYDWENDEAPDRTPDRWLDRTGVVSESIELSDHLPDHDAADDAGPFQSMSRRSITFLGRTRSTHPDPELVAAIRALQSRMPRAKDTTIARHLRRAGWTDVTGADVQLILGSAPNDPPKAGDHTRANKPAASHPRTPRQTSQDLAAGTPVGASQSGMPATPDSAQRATPTPPVGARRQELVRAIRALRAEFPRLRRKGLTARLRARGWHDVTPAEVQAAYESSLAPTPAPQGRSNRPLAARGAHPDACPACGVVVSSQGRCRCS